MTYSILYIVMLGEHAYGSTCNIGFVRHELPVELLKIDTWATPVRLFLTASADKSNVTRGDIH